MWWVRRGWCCRDFNRYFSLTASYIKPVTFHLRLPSGIFSLCTDDSLHGITHICLGFELQVCRPDDISTAQSALSHHHPSSLCSLAPLSVRSRPPFRLAASVSWCWSWSRKGGDLDLDLDNSRQEPEAITATRGEQLKWSLTFRLYIGRFPCAQRPGPVHTARLGRVCFLHI